MKIKDKFTKKNVLNFLMFFLLFFCSLFSSVLLGSFVSDNKAEICGNLVGKYANKNGFAYSEIISPKEDKDFIGQYSGSVALTCEVPLRDSLSHFIKCDVSDTYTPIKFFTYDDEKVFSYKTISSPTNSIFSFYNNFELFNSEKIKADPVDHRCVYITEAIAGDILNKDEITDKDCLELVSNKQRVYTPNNGYADFTILGVIKSKSLGCFSQILGEKFVLTNYSFQLYHLSGGPKTFCTVFYNKTTSLGTDFTIIFGALSNTDYTITFIDPYGNRAQEIETMNKRIESIDNFAHSDKKTISVILSSLCLTIFPLSSCLIFIKKRKDLTKGILPISFLAAFVLNILLFTIAPVVILGDTPFLLNGYFATTLLFVLSIIIFGVLSFVDVKRENFFELEI